jgi:hypothetical protein
MFVIKKNQWISHLKEKCNNLNIYINLVYLQTTYELRFREAYFEYFFPRKYKYRCIRVYGWLKDDKYVIWMWILLILHFLVITTDANNSNKHYSRKLFYMYMWSGCELIDTKNISLPNQKMKYQSYSHSDDIFIILKSTINTDTSIFVFSREKIFKIRFPKT